MLTRCLAIVPLLLFAATTVRAETDYCKENYDSQALLIGNGAYQETMKVPYAHNDVDAMRTFLIDKLCYRPGNIEVMKDATFNNIRRWLGRESDPHGRLWDLVSPGRSNVFVYYSGHGVPEPQTRKAYLLPVDADPNRPADGYALHVLDDNLKALKRRIGESRTVTLVLDACFSGRSAGGDLQRHSGAIVPQMPDDTELVRFSASQAGQLAYWSEKSGHGLFTEVFLEAVNGGADTDEHNGNRDGIVSGTELRRFIADQVAQRARALHGRDQSPALPKADRIEWRLAARAPRAVTPEGSSPAAEIVFWKSIEKSDNPDLFKAYLKRYPQGLFVDIARIRIDTLTKAPADIVEVAPPATRILDFVDTIYLGGGRRSHVIDRAYYATRVAYYDKGQVPRTTVMADKRRFFRRWPDRETYRLADEKPLIARGAARDTYVVSFRIRYAFANRKRHLSGVGTVTLTMHDLGNGFEITGETSRVDKAD